MGLLDHLWDDTLAGPPPDTGLGRLRKSYSFSPSSLAAAAAPPRPLQVTRSITILRSSSSGGSSPPSTPSSAASSPRGAPESPLSSPTPRGDWKRLRRKSMPAAAEGPETAGAEPRSPTVYDWVVISAMDR